MKTVGGEEGGKDGGTMGEKIKLADSSPLHTPVVRRWCGEDEEG